MWCPISSGTATASQPVCSILLAMGMLRPFYSTLATKFEYNLPFTNYVSLKQKKRRFENKINSLKIANSFQPEIRHGLKNKWIGETKRAEFYLQKINQWTLKISLNRINYWMNKKVDRPNIVIVYDMTSSAGGKERTDWPESGRSMALWWGPAALHWPAIASAEFPRQHNRLFQPTQSIHFILTYFSIF